MYSQNSNFPINNYQQNMPYNYSNNSDDRLVGGFAFPFLLGGVTGAAIAPAFWNNRPYYNNYYYPQYGPQYGPYYRPYRYY